MAKKIKKCNHDEVTLKFLKLRTDIMASAGYAKPKYVEFCEEMLARGHKCTLYEARETVSKYVTVYGPGDVTYIVRFSNHRPNRVREARKDCDFFVGQVNFGQWKTTTEAISAVENCFNAL